MSPYGVLLGLLLAQAPGEPAPGLPALLQEPEYVVEKEGDTWRVRKPGQAWVIFEGKNRVEAERRKNALPRLRLNRAFVKFDPFTGRRTLIEDWTGQSDAQEIEADIHALLRRFAPAAQTLLSLTPVYMARLNGASGHTAEEPDDRRRFVIYVDPFRATGRVHAASTIIHELSHVERYRMRGFHVNRAAAVLPKTDFTLLGAADELAAYQTEAAFIRSFVDSISTAAGRRAVREAMPSRKLRWPMALTVLLGFEGPPDTEARMKETRAQIGLDLQRQAIRYWDIHHKDRLDRALEASIRDWYSRSREWKDIAGQRADWLDAGAQVRPPLIGGTRTLRPGGR